MEFRPKIKICGITNIADALAAVKDGADFIGLNFYRKSPRYVDLVVAAEIVQELSDKAQIVGVFVNEAGASICEIARSLSLDAIQLHGDESFEFAEYISRAAKVPVIRAIRLSPNEMISNLRVPQGGYLLLDAFADGVYGGSGRTIDWNLARSISSNFGNVFLAGGLTPENVQSAIKTARPFAVDVCSSIECSPGKKDHQKMKQFIEAVKLG
jgi:phosphoribosylanthranilate isomerase